MSTAKMKRPLTESLEVSTKRLRIDRTSPDDDAFLSEYSDDESLSGNDFDNRSKGTSTPLTPISTTSTPKLPPCRQKILNCSYPSCTKTFNRPARLASHLRSHTNTRPFICTYDDCTKSYIEEKHLKQHIKGTHTHERSHHCDWDGCSKCFLTATRLRRHKAAHEGHERFRCTSYPPCNQTFRKHQTLQRHIRGEHMQLAPFPCMLIDEETGKECGAGFDGSVGLKRHQERVHGSVKFYCADCPSTDGMRVGFSTDAQLQKHIKTEHVKCLFCENKFSSQRELQKHIESQHSGNSLQERKTVACTYAGCTKTFVKKSNLSVHVRTAHNGERFICGSFNVSETVDLVSWDGDDACGRDFYSKVNLEDHIRIAHLGFPSAINSKKRSAGTNPRSTFKPSIVDNLIGEPPIDPRRTFACSIPACESKFIRAYDLEVHLRTKHDGSILELPEGESDREDREAMDALYEQPDIEWEMQRRVLEGGAFWIGAEDEESAWQMGDQWLQEEEEMRALVGDGCIDPALGGL